ncbi:sodium/glutamate symporter [Synechococcus sp. Cruz-9H2]|uniref:sodium/glutamate symporter n=1 Tax=unclassified Synechococcus TaxID=2626047 RepID=UPI0020CE168B|nr:MULTISPECIES: sodium/glutamate symporter [unclassified Synechococcus]MCP9820186.1 sodium/glutamate symporter [Synechococcus sp. Cruz-9H2]MCP9844574.1 sodium/glutamate symporter [Synechococcus sp. Edmonson 11F2]MCP9856616.1 sodium/glutamate symporter [Synechococcus sp. Cruz-9C9]MCP9863901.1 sodium/glutamate symporter [Synechococcus sp. Cruz-7E5]MCP9871177.1 sodium/glutamate symporter [Synechococcus sp. Cruz-7B9]
MQIESFATFNIAIVVLAVGKWLNQRLALLRNYNIPEPVSSGLLVCLLLAIVHSVSGLEISFNLATRDFLLLYFFASIGLNADIKTLVSGGRPLIVLLLLTIFYTVLQNLVGAGVATALGLNPLLGVLGGSVSMVGGHGTSIAWAPRFVQRYGIDNALEIGIACATFGLVLASLMGGPIARFLIRRNNLKPSHDKDNLSEQGINTPSRQEEVSYFSLLRTFFWLNMSLVLGEGIYLTLKSLGGNLPLFVCCLFGAILLTNTVPRLVRIRWPARTRSLAIVSDISLGIFLTMSLMSLQLWTIAGLAGPILSILAAQFVVAICYTLFLVFRAMGGSYDAAVISAGFSGFSLGATPTAMANMAAVANKYGPAPQAFIIVPLVSGFFVDISNSLIIQRFVNWLS